MKYNSFASYGSYYIVRSFGCLVCCLVAITRSGAVDLNTGSLRFVSHAGFYWSSTTYLDVNNAYRLTFYGAATYPSCYIARWIGCSVFSDLLSVVIVIKKWSGWWFYKILKVCP